MSTPASRRLIACLPVSTPDNPYQDLLMQGLRSDSRFDARHGARGKHFAALRTWWRLRPAYIHYDWNTPYFLRPSLAKSALYGVLFLAELWVVRTVLRCRIVFTLHQLEAHDAPHPGLQTAIQRRFVGLCEWVRVMWPSTARRAIAALGIPEEKVRVLPEGSYVGFYPDNLSTESCRNELGLSNGDLVLLHFGSVKPYKGLEALLETFQAIPAPNLRLVVAGECRNPRLAERIERLAAADSRIQCRLGHVPVSRVQVYFRACDAVVLPFEKIENSGSAILAMGFARPVIAPMLGALPERLGEQRDLLFSAGGLRTALEGALALGRDGLATRGLRNREAVSRHGWPEFAQFFE